AAGLLLLVAGFCIGQGNAPRPAQAATAHVQAATFILTAMATPTTAATNQPISFAASVDGNPPNDLGFSWNFGDGSLAQSGSSVTHAYTTAGAFTATVTATSAGTPSNTASTDVPVT